MYILLYIKDITYSQLENVLCGCLDNDLTSDGHPREHRVHLRDSRENLAGVGVDILTPGGEEELRTGQA